MSRLGEARVGVDPRWREMSASLRRGVVYVKMPLTKAYLLLHFLDGLNFSSTEETPNRKRLRELRDLLSEEIRATEEYSALVPQPSLFYRLGYREARQDALALQEVEDQDLGGNVRLFRRCLSRGSEGDPDLDWIARVGGPKPDSPLEGLSEGEIILDELDFPSL